MPIKQGYTTVDGERKGYYQWNGGQRYYYEPGDASSRTRAKNNAREQQKAAYASGYDG